MIDTLAYPLNSKCASGMHASAFVNVNVYTHTKVNIT